MTALRRLRALLALVLGFLWDLLASSLSVARIVLSPRAAPSPAIIVMAVEVRADWAVALLAYFTSLTPGSTCLHVSDDRRRLYLHILDMRDEAATVARFRRVYEAPIRALEG